MKKQEMLMHLIQILLMVAMVFAFIFALKNGFEKQEIVECYKLQDQSVKFAPEFYLTNWEKAQCDSHQIIINAPIK